MQNRLDKRLIFDANICTVPSLCCNCLFSLSSQIIKGKAIKIKCKKGYRKGSIRVGRDSAGQGSARAYGQSRGHRLLCAVSFVHGLHHGISFLEESSYHSPKTVLVYTMCPEIARAIAKKIAFFQIYSPSAPKSNRAKALLPCAVAIYIALFFLFTDHPSCRGDEREHRRRAADKNGGAAVVARRYGYRRRLRGLIIDFWWRWIRDD